MKRGEYVKNRWQTEKYSKNHACGLGNENRTSLRDSSNESLSRMKLVVASTFEEQLCRKKCLEWFLRASGSSNGEGAGGGGTWAAGADISRSRAWSSAF